LRSAFSRASLRSAAAPAQRPARDPGQDRPPGAACRRGAGRDHDQQRADADPWRASAGAAAAPRTAGQQRHPDHCQETEKTMTTSRLRRPGFGRSRGGRRSAAHGSTAAPAPARATKVTITPTRSETITVRVSSTSPSSAGRVPKVSKRPFSARATTKPPPIPDDRSDQADRQRFDQDRERICRRDAPSVRSIPNSVTPGRP